MMSLDVYNYRGGDTVHAHLSRRSTYVGMGRKELQIVDLSGSRLDFKWKLQVNQINKDRNSDNSRLKWEST